MEKACIIEKLELTFFSIPPLLQSEPSRVSEPVSLNTAGSQGGSSHGAGSANEEEAGGDSPAGGSDKNGGSGTEGEGTEETGESEEDLDLDPTFVAPFKHRNVLMDEGAIFKQKYEIYEELGRGR